LAFLCNPIIHWTCRSQEALRTGGSVAQKARILIVGNPAGALGDGCLPAAPDCEITEVDSWARGLDLLQSEHFDAIYAPTQDPSDCERVQTLLQAEQILKGLPDGVAVVNPDLRILWCNAVFEAWCRGAARGRGFYDALGSPEVLGPDYSPFHTALAGSQ